MSKTKIMIASFVGSVLMMSSAGAAEFSLNDAEPPRSEREEQRTYQYRAAPAGEASSERKLARDVRAYCRKEAGRSAKRSVVRACERAVRKAIRDEKAKRPRQ